MSFRKIIPYIELLRPLNVLIAFLSIAAATFLAGATAEQWKHILLASLAGGLIAGGANAINDYFDVEIDRINKSNRPLPRGSATREEAWGLWLTVSVVGLLLNIFLNSAAFVIAGTSVVILYFYSAVFKRSVLIGNFLVATMTGMAFIYGGVVAEHVDRAVIPAIFAFHINFARELVKDVEDLEGDRRENAKTFAVKYGATQALTLASITILILIVVTFVPYIVGAYSISYLLLVLLVDIGLIYVLISMWRDQTKENLGKLSMILKVNMLIGLVAIFLGS